MRITNYFSLMALVIGGMTMAACSDSDNVDDVTSNIKVPITLNMPLNVQKPELKNATATFTDVNSKKEYTATTFTPDGDHYVDTLTLPQGTYNVTVKGDISYAFDDSTVISSKVKSERQNVLASDQGVVMALNTYKAQDGLVLSEIFFTGTLTPEGKQYSDDQYFKIGNNSDSTIYLDGLAIVESAFLTVEKESYSPDIMDKAMTADAVYVIPGNGKDHPLEPGKEVVLALNARNHKEINANSIDLSKADFEFYDESSNPAYSDDDNPNVPNLINWYDYSATYFSLHNRSFKSYAIARPTVDAETFIQKYKYVYTYKYTFGEYSFDMDDEGFKIPNDWIIDGVNLSVADSWQWNVLSPSIDAGWTHCGSVDRDQNRYGKAVVRKKENGKWIDTNNSTNDFNADAKPSLFN